MNHEEDSFFVVAWLIAGTYAQAEYSFDLNTNPKTVLSSSGQYTGSAYMHEYGPKPYHLILKNLPAPSACFGALIDKLSNAFADPNFIQARAKLDKDPKYKPVSFTLNFNDASDRTDNDSDQQAQPDCSGYTNISVSVTLIDAKSQYPSSENVTLDTHFNAQSLIAAMKQAQTDLSVSLALHPRSKPSANSWTIFTRNKISVLRLRTTLTINQLGRLSKKN